MQPPGRRGDRLRSRASLGRQTKRVRRRRRRPVPGRGRTDLVLVVPRRLGVVAAAAQRTGWRRASSPAPMAGGDPRRAAFQASAGAETATAVPERQHSAEGTSLPLPCPSGSVAEAGTRTPGRLRAGPVPGRRRPEPFKAEDPPGGEHLRRGRAQRRPGVPHAATAETRAGRARSSACPGGDATSDASMERCECPRGFFGVVTQRSLDRSIEAARTTRTLGHNRTPLSLGVGSTLECRRSPRPEPARRGSTTSEGKRSPGSSSSSAVRLGAIAVVPCDGWPGGLSRIRRARDRVARVRRSTRRVLGDGDADPASAGAASGVTRG